MVVEFKVKPYGCKYICNRSVSQNIYGIFFMEGGGVILIGHALNASAQGGGSNDSRNPWVKPSPEWWGRGIRNIQIT
jgi:hypothetical protein